jgi:hypothetical protein
MTLRWKEEILVGYAKDGMAPFMLQELENT